MSLEPVTIVDANHLRAYLRELRSGGKKIGFVPTMGALHKGHLSLVSRAKERCDHVVVSIFVNPTQFGPNEDFASYPRTLREDLTLLQKEGVEVVYAPNANSMYPTDYQTFVVNEELSQRLCGASRPGHFRGVLTIVLKLFNVVQPDVAIFGKKDYQQFVIIKNMVRDLQLGIEIIGGEIEREPDGLAMSSRNRYFTAADRPKAAVIAKALNDARDAASEGERDPTRLVGMVKETLSSEKDLTIDYVECCEPRTLRPLGKPANGPMVLLVAVYLAGVRLIDNIELLGDVSVASDS